MPKDSEVGKVYDALVKKGMSKERAAKISQAQTGQALATGKKAKEARTRKGKK